MSTRKGVFLSDEQAQRLDAAAKRHAVPQSWFLAAVVSVMSDDEQSNLIARFKELRAIEEDMRREADRALLGYIRGKTLDEMRQLVAASRSAGV